MEERIVLTPQQLLNVCVSFSNVMGWIKSPGGGEWYNRMEGYGGPEPFAKTLHDGMRQAMDQAARDGACADLESLQRLKAEYEGGALT